MRGTDEGIARQSTRRPLRARGVAAGATRDCGYCSRASGAQRGWSRAWTKAAPRPRYRVVIVGGGGHGLATAFYLASEFGITDVAVLEKGPIGLGNVGRNTTLIRSNYFQPDNIRFYDYSLQLWERHGAHAEFQCHGQPARHPQSVSHRGAARSVHAPCQRHAGAGRGRRGTEPGEP